MLSASWCGYCAQARRLFVTHAIEYCEFDIETSRQGAARYRAIGNRGVPVILVGRRILQGYAEAPILAAIRAEGLMSRAQ